MPIQLGRVLLIANPIAQNGRGAAAATRALGLLRARVGYDNVVMQETERPWHAAEIVRHSRGFDTVIALGGDGVIHEAVGGIMEISEDERPAFGIIPVGSGNDYARSLGMSDDVDEAVTQLMTDPLHTVDIGCCNGTYFTETVSFGLDAAIAIETVERRKRTGKTGTQLYFAAGINQLLHHLRKYSYRMSVDGGDPVDSEMFILAVQNGQTYGGGFKVCPDARIDDGVLDVCVAHPPLNTLSATYLFVKAKEGRHVGARQIEFARGSSVHIEFDEDVPAQIDGEALGGRTFDITLIPRALRVITPRAVEYAAHDADAGYVRIGG